MGEPKGMRTYGADDTAALLPYDLLAEEIATTLTNAASGEVHALPRSVATLPGDGSFLLMGAADAQLAVAKVATVHPLNAAAGLPTIHAALLLIDAKTGVQRALIDGSVVTVKRTAALSLLAAQRLGAKGGKVVVVGAGAQGWGHVEALATGIGIDELLVHSRTDSKALALVDHANSIGISARHLERLDADTLASADIIVTATNSYSSVLPPNLSQLLRPEATILAVGAFREEMAEIPPELVAACEVVVDDLEGAKVEAGDLIQAASSGRWSWESASELGDHLSGMKRAGKPVLFKSVGHSMWDLAAGRLAVRQL